VQAMSRSPLLLRLKGVFLRTWYLGFTSFGGPVVHFQIFHSKFVDGPNPWIDEQTVSHPGSLNGSADNAYESSRIGLLIRGTL
jgi:hypothetical protein